MTAISKAWVSIADTAVDPDSPIDAQLMTGLRDDLVHLREWLGASYFAGAVQDHSHDGVNSALVPIGANSLRNGGFESGSGNWSLTAYTGGTISVGTTGAISGLNALAITSTVLANGGGYAASQEFIPCGACLVDVAASLYGSVGAVPFALQINWYSAASSGSLISTSTVAGSASGLSTNVSTVTGNALAPSGAKYCRIVLVGGTPGASSPSVTGTIFVDNVFVSVQDPATTGQVAATTLLVNNGYTSAALTALGTSLTKLAEVLCPVSCILTSTITLNSGSVYYLATARIYKNGVAYGTSRSTTSTTNVTFIEDLAFSAGDLIQIYIAAQGGVFPANAQLALKSAGSSPVETRFVVNL